MDPKKLVIVVVVALLLFLLITQPADSAAKVHTILGWLQSWAESIVTFVQNLFA